MVTENIKYDFNQILTGLKAFVANIELKLHEISPSLPVFILNSGDSSYYLSNKFENIDNPEQDVILKTPRFIISFDDPQPMTDQNTNQYNQINYLKDDLNYVATARRVAIQLTANTDFVSPNFIKALENFEIISTINARQNAFTYEFMGNTFEGAYNISSNSTEKPAMDISSGTRNFSVKTSFELQLHLIVPRIETIKLLSDTGFDSIGFDINSKGETSASDDKSLLLINKQ